MANDTTRRTLLGALALAPAVIAAPAVNAAPSTAWDQAMARFQAIKAEHDAAWAAFTGNPDANADRMQALADAYCEAEDALMEMPAPNARALQWKMETVFNPGSDGFTDSWRADYVKPLLDDIARLAGRA